jgi:hypothetical protein
MSESDERDIDDYTECSDDGTGSDTENNKYSSESEQSASDVEYLSDNLSDEESDYESESDTPVSKKAAGSKKVTIQHQPSKNARKQSKEISLMTPKEIKGIMKNSVSKAKYLKSLPVETKRGRGRPAGSKNVGSKYVECKTCGRQYTRANATAHKNTQRHLAYKEMNQKIRDILLNR